VAPQFPASPLQTIELDQIEKNVVWLDPFIRF
jgi:hypothetical protein